MFTATLAFPHNRARVKAFVRTDGGPASASTATCLSEDIAAMRMHAARELEADPSYEPQFRPPPGGQRLQVELTPEDDEVVHDLLAIDLYGNDAGEAIRVAFMRWCNRHVTRVRRTYMEFAR